MCCSKQKTHGIWKIGCNKVLKGFKSLFVLIISTLCATNVKVLQSCYICTKNNRVEYFAVFFKPWSLAGPTYRFFTKRSYPLAVAIFSHVTYSVCTWRRVFQRVSIFFWKIPSFVLISWNLYFVKAYLNIFEENFECVDIWF